MKRAYPTTAGTKVYVWGGDETYCFEQGEERGEEHAGVFIACPQEGEGERGPGRNPTKSDTIKS